jgi:peptide subunit release factor 1 (eRF1)
MTDVEAIAITFQCPQCGHDLEQSMEKLKTEEHRRCPGCGIGINTDTKKLSNVAEEIRKAVDKVPPEITIKFFR